MNVKELELTKSDKFKIYFSQVYLVFTLVSLIFIYSEFTNNFDNTQRYFFKILYCILIFTLINKHWYQAYLLNKNKSLSHSFLEQAFIIYQKNYLNSLKIPVRSKNSIYYIYILGFIFVIGPLYLMMSLSFFSSKPLLEDVSLMVFEFYLIILLIFIFIFIYRRKIEAQKLGISVVNASADWFYKQQQLNQTKYFQNQYNFSFQIRQFLGLFFMALVGLYISNVWRPIDIPIRGYNYLSFLCTIILVCSPNLYFKAIAYRKFYSQLH